MKIFKMPAKEFIESVQVIDYLNKVGAVMVAGEQADQKVLGSLKAQLQNKKMLATDSKAPEILELADQIDQIEKNQKIRLYQAQQIHKEMTRIQEEFLHKLIPSDTTGAKKAATDILNALEKEKKK